MGYMSRVEEIFELLPASITVGDKKYILNVWKVENFEPIKYGARYGLEFSYEDKPETFPANVLVDDGDFGKGWEYTISMGCTLEETLEDLYRRVKGYINK